MEYNLLLNKIADHYKNNLPFMLFSLPKSESVSGFFQKDRSIYTTDSFSEPGVILAPFDLRKVTYLIPSKSAEIVESKFPIENIKQQEIAIADSEIDHLQHIKLVEEALDCIENKKAQKIVVSRRKEIRLKQHDIKVLLSRLLNLFPAAFRYVWFHPETGIWCGASPELLVSISGATFTTMALAGTQKINKNRPPDWTYKEIDEQQYVTDAITTRLQKVTSVVKISKTYTDEAGSIAHLRTDISGTLKKGKATLGTITHTLHPTPAVCGTPQKFSKEFILTNENYDREFYTGFVGLINQEEVGSQLFVNLRCLNIKNSTAYLYVGGGITLDSKLEDEWQETQNKLQTMLQVVRPFIY